MFAPCRSSAVQRCAVHDSRDVLQIFDKSFIKKVLCELPRIAQIRYPQSIHAEVFLVQILQIFETWLSVELQIDADNQHELVTVYTEIAQAARFLSEIEHHLAHAREPTSTRPPIDETTLGQLRAITEWAEDCLSLLPGRVRPHQRGRPHGPRNFRNLPLLVIGFDRKARLFGGHFTLDKKLRKGSLLTALDDVRARLVANPRYQWLAAFLPPPDRHPVSTYERVLIRQGRFNRRSPKNQGEF
jgi:hypothetical protein